MEDIRDGLRTRGNRVLAAPYFFAPLNSIFSAVTCVTYIPSLLVRVDTSEDIVQTGRKTLVCTSLTFTGVLVGPDALVIVVSRAILLSCLSIKMALRCAEPGQLELAIPIITY